MAHLAIHLDGDNCWPDLKEAAAKGRLIDVELAAVTCLPGGMQSGKPSVSFRVDLPDGRTVIAETSLELFLAAGDAFKARYGDPRFEQARKEEH